MKGLKDVKNKKNAKKLYSVKNVVEKYMSSVEEVINIEKLNAIFEISVKKGFLSNILGEIVRQSKVEFNYDEVENS